MKRTLRRPGGLGFVLFALFALAACSSGGAEANPGSGETPADDPDEQRLQYTQCLRDQGLDVDDPGAGDQFGHGVEDHDEAKLGEAAAACREDAYGGEADHGSSSEDTEEMLAYIRCLRAEGVDDIADPDPETGRLRIEDMQKFWDPDPQMRLAQQACKDQEPGRLQDGGH